MYPKQYGFAVVVNSLGEVASCEPFFLKLILLLFEKAIYYGRTVAMCMLPVPCRILLFLIIVAIDDNIVWVCNE